MTLKDKVEKASRSKRDKLVEVLSAIGENEKANGETFKSLSYFKAISSLKNIKDDSELTEQTITSMKGIGSSIYQKIVMILQTGTCPQYDAISSGTDPRIAFMKIHGVGPKKATELVKAGFNTIEELREGFPNMNDKQSIGLKHYEELNQKIPIEEIKKHETLLKSILNTIDKSSELTVAGSYRRMKEESGDIDVLIKSKNKGVYKKFISKLGEVGYLTDELALGPKKYNGICLHSCSRISRRIDIMYTKPEEYPFAILYFTGSCEFNQMMRQYILDKGMTINEYSLKSSDTKEKVDHLFFKEKDIFDYVGMDYVEPCDRI